jgi:hypothetical protein
MLGAPASVPDLTGLLRLEALRTSERMLRAGGTWWSFAVA